MITTQSELDMENSGWVLKLIINTLVEK